MSNTTPQQIRRPYWETDDVDDWWWLEKTLAFTVMFGLTFLFLTVIIACLVLVVMWTFLLFVYIITGTIAYVTGTLIGFLMSKQYPLEE